MTPSAIATLRQDFGYFFDDRGPLVWPTDTAIIRGATSDQASDFSVLEDALNDDIAGETRSESPIDFHVSERSADEDLGLRNYNPASDSDVARISSVIEANVGSNFPGGPYAGGPTKFALPPDAYGCYLPWHDFQPTDWGIYLFFENMVALRDDLHALTRPILSRSDCAIAAHAFVFHHEAYHNAVETFAARLELAHREALYIKGFRRVYVAQPLPNVHEESLATAYALQEVQSEVYIRQPAQVRNLKRRVATNALMKIVSAMSPIYAAALPIIRAKRFDADEQRFQEHNVAQALPLLPALPNTRAWLAFPDALRPSLQRNKSYAYVVSTSNPLLRSRANIKYIDRATFVQKLNASVGGSVISQKRSKEPKWRSSSGKTVSIPKGGEIQIGTAAAILRQLGVDEGIYDFMRRA